VSPRFLVDEDMPRSMIRKLRAAGYEAEDVRDIGLRGHTDEEVFAYAQAGSMTLISADMGFSNPWRFPAHSHAGIILLRLPNEMSSDGLSDALIGALASLADVELRGALIIVEAKRLRIRR
jgi:predicted nuclease of predicted toxin-antitoxin system